MRVAGDAWEGWCAAPPDTQPGDALTIVVRPEVIRLLRFGAPRPRPGLAWQGIVRQRFFRGTRNLYTIDVGAQRFQVDAPPDQSFAAGAVVSLTVDAAHTWAVRE